MHNKPLVSIITATYNAGASLEATIKSVVNQTYDNIQYIIVDGGSNDITSDVVNKFSDVIDVYISEKDSGIADAWNKGLRVAKGDFICFLNSGDTYDSDFIKIHMCENRLCDVVQYGITYMKDFNGRILAKIRKEFDGDVNSGFKFIHTSCFIPKATYNLVGNFDVNIKIAIDTDWLIRAYKLGVTFQSTNAKNFMDIGGVSDNRYFEAQTEYINILSNHFSYSRWVICKLYLKAIAKSMIKKTIGFGAAKTLKLQMLHLMLFLVNVVNKYVPFWSIRRLVYKAAGITVDNSSIIHRNVKLFSYGRLSVGSGTVINNGCYLDNRDEICIGNNISIAHDVKIYTTGHDIHDEAFCGKKKPVMICDNVVLFAGVILMPGVTIGKNSVILPYAVVTKSVEENSVYGGFPAVKIGSRNLKSPNYILDYKFWFAN